MPTSVRRKIKRLENRFKPLVVSNVKLVIAGDPTRA